MGLTVNSMGLPNITLTKTSLTKNVMSERSLGGGCVNVSVILINDNIGLFLSKDTKNHMWC